MFNKKNGGLVSCLCISFSEYSALDACINCFLSQSYENKELVIIHWNNLEYLKELQKYKDLSNIRFYHLKPETKDSIPDLLDYCFGLCKGTFICFWSSVDWHHKKRIENQANALLDSCKEACVLTNILLFDKRRQATYYSNAQIFVGTLFFKKDVLKKHVEMDKSVKKLSIIVGRFFDNSMIYPLIYPTLYIYNFESKNLLSQDLFQKVLNVSQKLSSGFNNCIWKIVGGEFSNDQALKILDSKKILHEINYVHPNVYFLKVPSLPSNEFPD